MEVFCDFDGTISIEDGTDVILKRFADAQWEAIEEEWKKGTIGSAECMQRQIPLIRATREELDKALDTIAIDPDFASFAIFCRAHAIPLTIISDGVDYFIKRILARHHLDYLPVIANRLSINGANGHTQYQLSSPYSQADCASASGVCKCRAVQSLETRIYVGDGRSDFCVSDKVDMVFAKGKLAEFCTQKEIEFIPYQQFSEVTQALKAALPALIRNQPEIPAYAFA